MKRQGNIDKTKIYIIFNGEEWIFPKDKDMEKWDQDDNLNLSLIFWYFGLTKISLYTFITLIFFGLYIYNLDVRYININTGLFGRNSAKIKDIKVALDPYQVEQCKTWYNCRHRVVRIIGAPEVVCHHRILSPRCLCSRQRPGAVIIEQGASLKVKWD